MIRTRPFHIVSTHCALQAFLTRTEMEKHVVETHPEMKGKAYKCELCGVLTAQHPSLLRHMKRKHKQ